MDLSANSPIQSLLEQDWPALAESWAISRFIATAFYQKKFEPSSDWARAVGLSTEGEDARKKILDQYPDAQESLVKFYLLQAFYHTNLLVDPATTDLDLCKSLLQEIYSKADGRWAPIFGKELYVKYNTSHFGDPESLPASAMEALLKDMPAGIFQVGTVLSGPLGFLESAELRFAPPTISLPLWHCSDYGCRALHHVSVRQYGSDAMNTIVDFHRVLVDAYEPKTSFSFQLSLYAAKMHNVGPKPFRDMVPVVCECIIGNERDSVCVRALKTSRGAQLRKSISKLKQAKGSPEQIVAALTYAEKQQFLLLFRNTELVEMFDQLIMEHKILIPPSEIRMPKNSVDQSTGYHTEVSSLGVRSTYLHPILVLHGELWAAYKSMGFLEDLRWRIRSTKSDEASLRIALMDYIRDQTPNNAVKNLVLPSREVTIAFEQNLSLKLGQNENETESIDRILWKCGFGVARYGRELTLIRGRIQEFKAAVLHLPAHAREEDYAPVRAVGVNLFVSVEALLEDFVSFNAWLLSSDHFSEGDFAFNKASALRSVRRALGTSIKSGSYEASWDEAGANTLGTELVYLTALRDWIIGRSSAQRDELARPKEDFPHYINQPFSDFPFQHVELWADASADALAEYAALVDNVQQQAAQADFAGVRNGLDHKREDGDFPTADRMLACALRLEQIVDLVDHRSLIPKLLWKVKQERDSYGNEAVSFQDYKGATSTFRGPTPVRGLAHYAKSNAPYVASPLNLLAVPNGDLLFKVVSKSEYSQYWNGYPMRHLEDDPAKQEEATDEAEEIDEGSNDPALDRLVVN